MTRSTRIISAALAAASLMAVPAVSQADSMTFGNRLDHEPSNSAPAHNCKEDGSQDATPACTRVGIDESFAVPGGLVAPMDGTITKLSVRAGAPGSMTFRLAKLLSLSRAPGFSAVGVSDGTGPTVNVQGRGFDENESTAIESFQVSVPVHKGDYLAIDSTSTSAEYCTSGGQKQAVFSPPLSSTPQTTSSYAGCDLMVQAEMVPSQPMATTTTKAKKHRKHRRHRHHKRHHKHHKHHKRHR
jgi:hypothetical protein